MRSHEQSAFKACHQGAFTAVVGLGSTVYIAVAGTVGLAAIASARLQGALVVIGGDLIPERFAHAKAQGFEARGHVGAK